MSDRIIPNIQKERIKAYLKSGKRFDGRKFDEFREIFVEKGISKKAEASVRVKIGKTEVLAGVKLGITTPYPDTPDEGAFMTSAELHPMASEEFEMGRPGIEAIELGRVIDRGIRESGFINLKKLCIKKGEKVWQVFLDIIALNDDGNLFDAAGIAALIALGNAKMPKYDEEEEKVIHELTEEPLPINKDALSVNITFHKIGEAILVDVGLEEEEISELRLGISMGESNGKMRISAMQKGKEGTLRIEEMEKLLKMAESVWSKMFPKIKSYVFED